MKIILGILIVVLIGLCGWIRYVSVRPTETHRAIIAGLKLELKESRVEYDATREALTSAEGEIESLQNRLALLSSGNSQGSQIQAAFPSPATPVPPVMPAVSEAKISTSGTLEDRLKELEAVYIRHHAPIESRENSLKTDLSVLISRRKSLENTELHFSEQSNVTTVEGITIGKRGVRTSDADRTRAHAKVAEKVEEVDREIARKQEELNQVLKEMEGLSEKYNQAVFRAKKEFGERVFSVKGK